MESKKGTMPKRLEKMIAALRGNLGGVSSVIWKTEMNFQLDQIEAEINRILKAQMEQANILRNSHVHLCPGALAAVYGANKG